MICPVCQTQPPLVMTNSRQCHDRNHAFVCENVPEEGFYFSNFFYNSKQKKNLELSVGKYPQLEKYYFRISQDITKPPVVINIPKFQIEDAPFLINKYKQLHAFY